MSADNMIAILRTEVHPSLEVEHEEGRTGEKERHGFEYRVVEIWLSATPFQHDEDGGNQVLIKDAAQLLPDPARRTFLRGGASLGALAVLAGCDITDSFSAVPPDVHPCAG